MLVGYLCDAKSLFLFSVGERLELVGGLGNGAWIVYE